MYHASSIDVCVWYICKYKTKYIYIPNIDIYIYMYIHIQKFVSSYKSFVIHASLEDLNVACGSNGCTGFEVRPMLNRFRFVADQRPVDPNEAALRKEIIRWIRSWLPDLGDKLGKFDVCGDIVFLLEYDDNHGRILVGY